MKSNSQLQYPLLSGGDSSNRSVLIVDDDFDQVEALTQWFIHAGYQVHSAYDPLQALEAARLHQFQIAIINASLPGMDGLELIHRLKQMQDGVQVVILSNPKQSEWRTKTAGVFAYLAKPCNMEKLETMVEQAIERAWDESAQKVHSVVNAEMSVAI